MEDNFSMDSGGGRGRRDGSGGNVSNVSGGNASNGER